MVCVAWVFFRAESVGEAVEYLQSMLSGGSSKEHSEILWMIIGILLAIDWFSQSGEIPFHKIASNLVRIVIYFLLAGLILIQYQPKIEFIYFAF